MTQDGTGYAQTVQLATHSSALVGKLPPRSPELVEDNTHDLAFQPRLSAQRIGVVSVLPALVNREPPQVWRMTQAPLQDEWQMWSLAWVVAAG